MTRTETSVMVEMVLRGSMAKMAKMAKTLLMSPIMEMGFLPGISWVLSSSERLLLVVRITQPINLIKAHLSIEQHLSDSDMALLRAFALKVESHSPSSPKLSPMIQYPQSMLQNHECSFCRESSQCDTIAASIRAVASSVHTKTVFNAHTVVNLVISQARLTNQEKLSPTFPLSRA